MEKGVSYLFFKLTSIKCAHLLYFKSVQNVNLEKQKSNFSVANNSGIFTDTPVKRKL